MKSTTLPQALVCRWRDVTHVAKAVTAPWQQKGQQNNARL